MTSRHRWTCSVCSHNFDWPWDDAPKLFGDDGGLDRLDPVWHKFDAGKGMDEAMRREFVALVGMNPEQQGSHAAAFEHCLLAQEMDNYVK